MKCVHEQSLYSHSISEECIVFTTFSAVFVLTVYPPPGSMLRVDLNRAACCPHYCNLYINDTLCKLEYLSLGVAIINVLAYADDIVLMAELETDLNIMLDYLGALCNINTIFVNSNKSKIIYF